MPSAKYSCSGSFDKLAKGKTTSDSGGAAFASACVGNQPDVGGAWAVAAVCCSRDQLHHAAAAINKDGERASTADNRASDPTRLARPRRCSDRVSAHWTGDVMEALLGEIAKGEVELAGDVLLHPPRDADAAGRGERFEAGGDVHAVAIDVVAIG